MSPIRHFLLPFALFPLLGMGQAGAEKALQEQQQAPAVAEPYQGGWSIPPRITETKETEALDDAGRRSAGSQLDALRCRPEFVAMVAELGLTDPRAARACGPAKN